MNPATQRRLSNWGCLLSLGALVAGAIAALLGHPRYLLSAVPITLIWILLSRAQGKAERQRELEAFAEAFRGFDGSPPRLAAPARISYGWPAFAIVFLSPEDLKLAVSQGRVETFKSLINEIHGRIHHQGREFNADQAVEVTCEEEFQPRPVRRPVTIGELVNHVAVAIVMLGMLLGILARTMLGREFTRDELGVFAWPLTILWLVSFFYMATHLAFTRTRTLVRVLWVITLTLFLLGLAAALLDGKRKPDQPSATTNEGSSSTQAQ